jgi:hypothetical protein
MNEFQDVPQYFYRVFDEGPQFHETLVFVASIPNAFYDLMHRNARCELERHMDWNNLHPTPFISMMASRKQALEFALQRVDKQRRTVTIAKIDSSRLKTANVKIHRMCALVEQTRLYLCVRCILANAVIQRLTLDDEQQYLKNRLV